jgi:hypothetical protein
MTGASRRATRRVEGSVLIVVAAVLVALVGAVLLVAELGMRLETRARLARASDAAALAAAASLCDRDAAGVARAIAAENAVGLGPLDVAVELGGLDADGDFGPAETPTAVRVRASAAAPALGAPASPPAPARAVATAALRRFGLVSLDPGGEIRLFGFAELGAGFANGEIHANGDIRVGGAPAFATAALSAGGAIRPGGTDVFDPWGGGAPLAVPRSATGAAPLPVPPVDDALLGELRARATAVYGPESPPDAILYLVDTATLPRFPATLPSETFGATFFFDLTDLSALGERPVIFFDAPETIGGERVLAALQPRNPLGHDLPNDPSGASRGFVFVSTVPILITAGTLAPGAPLDPFGGEGAGEVTVYGASDVRIFSSAIAFEGAVIRAGRDIELSAFSNEPRPTQRVRLVADRDIQLVDPTAVYDLGAGSPCPPAIAHAVRRAP